MHLGSRLTGISIVILGPSTTKIEHTFRCCQRCPIMRLHAVETVLSLGVELVVLILDSYLSYVGLYLAY